MVKEGWYKIKNYREVHTVRKLNQNKPNPELKLKKI